MGEYTLQIESVTGNELSQAIRLSGALTSDNVGEVLFHLSSVFDKKENVLDLSGITEIDFAGLKLICICHRTLPLSGKNLRIIGHTHAVIRDTIVSNDYQHRSKCAKDSHYGCVWTDMCPMVEEQKTSSNSASGESSLPVGKTIGGNRFEDH